MLGAVLRHPSLTELRRVLLATIDAHSLYEQFGFRPVQADRFLEIFTPAEVRWPQPPGERPPS